MSSEIQERQKEVTINEYKNIKFNEQIALKSLSDLQYETNFSDTNTVIDSILFKTHKPQVLSLQSSVNVLEEFHFQSDNFQSK